MDEQRLDSEIRDPGACAVDSDLVHPPVDSGSAALGASGVGQV